MCVQYNLSCQKDLRKIEHSELKVGSEIDKIQIDK